MTQERWHLVARGPESYEHYQVPSVFGRLARMFLQRIALRPGQRVLDVACGTGVVARHAAPILGPSGSIVGVDLNSNMLDVARAPARPAAPRSNGTRSSATRSSTRSRRRSRSIATRTG